MEWFARDAAVPLLAALLLVTVGALILVALDNRRSKKFNAQLHELMEELKESYARYKLAVESANDGIFYYDVASGRIYLSERFLEIIPMQGGRENELRGIVADLLLRVHKDYRGNLRTLLEDVEQKRVRYAQTELRMQGGPAEWILFKITWMEEEGRLRFGGSISDITERRRSEEQVRYYADHDPLTGIYNRRRFTQAMRDMFAWERGDIALYYMDLDNFKQVNDQLGHQAGDQMLREVATRVQGMIDERALFARIGGDEFVLALPTDGRTGEEMLAEGERIIGALNGLSLEHVQVGVSVGLAIYPEDSAALDELVHFADTAARESKRKGKNSVTRYYAGMQVVERRS